MILSKSRFLSVIFLFLNFCKNLLKLADQVLDIFNSDGEAKGALRNSVPLTDFLRHIGMCLRRRDT